MAVKRAVQSIVPKPLQPSWTQSKRITEFIAHVTPVTSPSQANLYVESLLESDKRIRNATHNITAWRIRSEGVERQQFNDDGEPGAGSRLLQLMQSMNLWDSMVVVTRWYGGVHLGPKRFRLITSVASDAFARAGMGGNTKEEKSKGKEKK
ncbi:hypothetical protein FGRMN_5283 [Fusarium graminum]|nr:hypothetical protein FGRMN_5283 [Fusarium graminum]